MVRIGSLQHLFSFEASLSPYLLSGGACNLICHHVGISWVPVLALLLKLDYAVAQLGNLTSLLHSQDGWKEPSRAPKMYPEKQMSISTHHKAHSPASGEIS